MSFRYFYTNARFPYLGDSKSHSPPMRKAVLLRWDNTGICDVIVEGLYREVFWTHIFLRPQDKHGFLHKYQEMGMPIEAGSLVHRGLVVDGWDCRGCIDYKEPTRYINPRELKASKQAVAKIIPYSWKRRSA